MSLTSDEMQKLIAEVLGRNRGPGYGISVERVAADGLTADVTVTFVAGRMYCCCEQFCHVPWDTAKFLELAVERGLVVAGDIKIRWHFVVEAGAMLRCNEAFGLPAVVARHEFDGKPTSKRKRAVSGKGSPRRHEGEGWVGKVV